MIDSSELKKNEHINEGDYVRIKLRQNQIPCDGNVKAMCESYIVLSAIDAPEVEQLKKELKEAQHNHILKHVIIDKADIKYIAVMEKMEELNKPKNEQQR